MISMQFLRDLRIIYSFMRLLLDTHVVLWAASEPEKLPSSVHNLLMDSANELLISVTTPWEMAIKIGTGKLSLPQPLSSYIEQQLQTLDAVLLPVELRHLAPISSLPLHHRDPFDRLLIAQSLVEGVPLVSADAAFDAYTGVSRLW